MKKLLLLFASLLTSALLWAQTDMTDRIVNPSFEEEREGWEIHNFGCQTNNAFTLKEGKIYLETWRPAGDRAGDARIKQVIEGLPAGSYTLACIAQNIQENDKTAVQTGTWMFANDDITQVNLPNRYEVNTVVVDGTLAIGFVAENATGNYVCVDAFTLTLNEPDEHTFEVFRQELVKLVAEAEALSENTGTAQQATLDACIAEAQAVIDGASDKDVTVVFVALREAIEAYHFSIASPSNPLEVTSRITNPDFENSTKGWTSDGFSSQTNSAFKLKQATTYLEIWGWEVVADAHIYQDVPLPNGNYHMTVLAQNIKESNASAKQTGAWFYGNTQQVAINLPGKYELDFTVVDGTARIGMKTEKCTGNYVCFDDIRLYYVGMDNDALMTELRTMIANGEALLAQLQSAATKSALQQAVENAKAVTDADGIGDKAAVLTQAIHDAEESIALYASFDKAITEAETTYNSLAGNEGENYKALIDQARAKCNAGTATPEEIEQLIAQLTKEGILYLAANGTGVVPTVTTYNFVPEGATGALGRLKVSGVSASKLKYQGFCWARHNEPTLKDDFTTTGEKLYDYPGLIYVMEPMEPATEYYVRAFAMTTDNQVGYGQVRRIITLPMGKCTWHYAYNGEEADNKRLAAAAEGAMYYYNHWTNIQNYGINVNFDPGDASAHCSYGGWMTVGPNAGYQKIGTVMHESGHGVGQGQIWQWSWTQLKGDTPWVPENLGDKDGGPTGGEIVNTEPAEGVWWQGERSNMMVYFLTDGQDLANGDWGHCGPFGVNGAGADNGTRILYIANALEVHGMGEDGMPPSGGSASPYYAFHSMDTTLYYISNEEVAYGGGTQYLTETSTGTLKYVKATADQAIADSAYAWNILFQPETCYYLFRNAKSGKYFTFKSGTIKSADVAQPGATESFHLMPSRYYARYGTKSNPIKHKGYWIVEGDRGQWAAPTMEAASNGRVNTTGQIFENNQVNQRWLLLTAQEAKALSDELGAINKSKLERYIEGARGILAAQHTETTEGVTESLAAVVDRVAPTLPSLTSVEQINADLADATTAITNYLVGTTPADMLPYDITFMLDNAEMDAIDGWTNDGDEVTITKGVAEVKDGKFDLYQTLPKMPKGVYRLTVNAFERPGTVATAAREFAAGTNNATTQIYLRTTANKTPVKHLMEDAQEEALGVGTERSCTQGYVPNNTTAATEYFNQGFYNNELVMRMSVKADLKVGIQNTKAITNDWIAFDNFHLYYYGDAVTPEDVTGISGVTAGTPDASRTYDLTGRTVTHPARGLYIRNGKTYIKK